MGSLLLPLNPLSTVAIQANSNSAYVGNSTEVYISTNTVCNLNSAIALGGNTFRLSMFGFNNVPGEKLGSVVCKLKAGVGGNISDATIATVTGVRDVGDSSPLGATFYLTIRPGTYAANVMNAAVVGVGSNPRDVGSCSANVSLVGGTTTLSNVILGLSFSGGDGTSNTTFPFVTIEQMA